MDACAALRDKLTEIKGLGPAAQYGLFLADEDPKRGVWLDSGRTLEHYLLRENVSVQELFTFSSISLSFVLLWIVPFLLFSCLPLAWWLALDGWGSIPSLQQPPGRGTDVERCIAGNGAVIDIDETQQTGYYLICLQSEWRTGPQRHY